VSGIGEKQAAAIRGIVNSFCRQIAERRSVRLLPGDSSPEMRSLILALACLWRGRLIRQDADPVREDFHGRLETILAGITVRNRFRWFFSGKKTKNRELQAVRELTELVSSPLFDRADSLCRQYRELEKLTGDEAEKDFEENYLSQIEYYCLVLTENYINSHYEDNLAHANDVEKRLDDSHCSKEYLIRENQQMLSNCEKYGLTYILIDDKYEIDIDLENE
jgi:hypothetical protein